MVCEAYFFVWIAIIVSATLHSAFIPTVFFSSFSLSYHLYFMRKYKHEGLFYICGFWPIQWISVLLDRLLSFVQKQRSFFKKHFMSLLSFQQFVEAKMLKAIAIWKIHLNSHNLCQTIEYIVVAYTPVLFLFAFIHSQRN